MACRAQGVVGLLWAGYLGLSTNAMDAMLVPVFSSDGKTIMADTSEHLVKSFDQELKRLHSLIADTDLVIT